MSKVRVRIAPSPTGDPHVGTAYMALFNLIFAKHHGGDFILRIEDTDQSRSKPEYEQNIYKALKWAKISWDEGPDVGGKHGPYRQSERLDIYQKYCQMLLDKNMAYKCFATPEELQEMRELSAKMGKRTGYDRRYRNLSDEEIKKREDAGQSYVVRLKIPLSGQCEYVDAIKGPITFPWADIDDQVLLKSDGFPTYHLANVVDDYLMEITHVIRGDEWISSTPKHLFLYEAFGFKKPVFMHLPLLLGKDGKKLSKRKNPTSIFYYRDTGYLPEAFINFLTLMGYSMKDDKEIYPLDQIIKEFDHKRIGTSGAFFDVKKLDWINQQYLITTISEDNLWDCMKGWIYNDSFMERLMPLCHTRIKTFGEFMELCYFFFVNKLPHNTHLLCPKKITPESSAHILQVILWLLEENDIWDSQAIELASRRAAEIFQISHKNILMKVLFSAITGKHQGPPLFSSFEILGKDRARARLLDAMEFLGGISNKRLSSLKKAFEKGDCHEMIKKEET